MLNNHENATISLFVDRAKTQTVLDLAAPRHAASTWSVCSYGVHPFQGSGESTTLLKKTAQNDL